MKVTQLKGKRCHISTEYSEIRLDRRQPQENLSHVHFNTAEIQLGITTGVTCMVILENHKF